MNYDTPCSVTISKESFNLYELITKHINFFYVLSSEKNILHYKLNWIEQLKRTSNDNVIHKKGGNIDELERGIII